MKPHLLLMAQNLEPHLGALNDLCEVHHYYNVSDKAALIQEFGEEIKLIGTNGHIGCSADLMSKLPNLEMIGCFGVGYDAIDTEAARDRGIAVTNTPDVLNDAVAELGLGLMISLARKIPQSDQYVRKGHWLDGDMPLTVELSGKTAGIVGLGRIGKELASRLQAMKMRVVYHGRNQQPNLPFEYYDDVTAMAQAVDWLVVSLPGGSETDGIISAEVLDALGPDGYFVNVARGSVVDEDALCERITSGKIAGAALDVFAGEPKVPASLLQAENVVLSPHAASATTKTRHDMAELVIKNMLAQVENRPLLTRVV